MNTTNDKGAPSNGTPPKTPRYHFNGAQDQRKRLLDWLKVHGSIDTITARRYLDIMAPAARLHELRHRFGYHIDTVWIKQPTECGRLHHVALYVLKSEGASNE
jgi:Helix-turn-helix domain